MNEQRPSMLTPALIGGAVAGILSGLPFLNCLCCLWIIGGAMLAAYLLAKESPVSLTAGDGAIVGALAGISAAVVDSLIGLPLRGLNLAVMRRMIERLSEFADEMPSGWENWINRSARRASRSPCSSSGSSCPRLIFAAVGRPRRDHRARPCSETESPKPPPGSRALRLKTQVIVNPESNQGRTRKRWAEIKEALRHFIKEFRYDFTEKPFEAIETDPGGHQGRLGAHHRRRRRRDHERDRQRLLRGQADHQPRDEPGHRARRDGLRPDQEPEHPVPAQERPQGHHRGPLGPDRRRPGEVPGGLRASRWSAFFLNIADFGIGGEVVRRVNERRLERKASSYVRCLVATMVQYRSKRLRIRIDGRDLPEERLPHRRRRQRQGLRQGHEDRPRGQARRRPLRYGPRQGHEVPRVLPPRLEAHQRQSPLPPQDQPHPRPAASRRCPGRRKTVLLELDGEQLGTLPAIVRDRAREPCSSRVIRRPDASGVAASDRRTRSGRPALIKVECRIVARRINRACSGIKARIVGEDELPVGVIIFVDDGPGPDSRVLVATPGSG